jgi:hypothetical protein
MSIDHDEQRLQRQTLRAVPETWREEILDAARAKAPAQAENTFPASWPTVLREWLWPHPAAWGTLTACWIAIVLLHQATAPSEAEIAQARNDARVAVAYSTLLSHPAAMALLADPADEPVAAPSGRRLPDLGRRRTPSASAFV